MLIGHSLGCTEAVFYLAQTHDPSVAALVLMGAHLDLRGDTWRFFTRDATETIPKARMNAC